MRRAPNLPRTDARWWRPVAMVVAAVVLLTVLFVTFRPDTAPTAPVVGREPDRAASALAPTPTAAPDGAHEGEPSALRGEAFPFQCRLRDVPDGPLGFVRLEAFGPMARKLSVRAGELTGESGVVDGEGDLVRDGAPVARLQWREADDGTVTCETGPVPQAEVTGVVVDVRGVPVPEAAVVGCGGRTVSDADGRFVLVASEGRACRVRAQQLAGGHAAGSLGIGASPSIDVTPPAQVTLEIERRTLDDVRAEVGREVTVLTALDRVELQRVEALGGEPDDEVTPEVAARRERIRRLEAALAGDDPDAVLQEWLGD